MIDQPPSWSRTIKTIAGIILLITGVYFTYVTRVLVVPIFMSLLVAYLLSPLVHFVSRVTKLPFLLSIGVVYLVVVASLVTIPVRILPRIINQTNFFIAAVPTYVEQGIELANTAVDLPNGDQFVLTDVMPVETIAERIVGFLPSLSAQSFNLFGSLASYTAQTVAWIAFVLFVSFYLIKDSELFLRNFVGIVPAEYDAEMYRLAYELNAVWNAFLRGQFIIALVMGSIVFVVASIIGLPYALLIALVAALSEFLPQIGPFVVLVPLTLVGLFQSDQSWVGLMLSPVWFAAIVGGGYIFINQMSNYFLYPRVLGNNLNMHPLVVFVGALAGFFTGGVVGVLLASPLIASGRVVFSYVYRKILDLPPFPKDSALPPPRKPPWLAIRDWMQEVLNAKGNESEPLPGWQEALQFVFKSIMNFDRSVRLWMKK